MRKHKNTADWSGEYKRFRPIEDKPPKNFRIPPFDQSLPVQDIRKAVLAAAMDYFYSYSRTVNDYVLVTSGVYTAIEVVHDMLPYISTGSRHILLFHGDIIRVFYVDDNDESESFTYYCHTEKKPVGKRAAVYLLFVFDEDHGVLQPITEGFDL